MTIQSTFEKAFFSTVRLRTRNDMGEVSDGTAFVFEYVSEDNTFPFLVTSRQLVLHAQEGRMALFQAKGTQPNYGKGYTLDIEKFGKLWFHHPDDQVDISVTPFVPFVRHVENTGVPIHFESFSQESSVNHAYFSDVEIGQEVLSIGYPPAYWDRDLLMPVVKQSIYASAPAVEYGGLRQCLLDMPLQSGWLGGPVVSKKFSREKGPQLLGMLAHSGKPQDDPEDPAPASNEMVVMVKTELVLEAITAYLKEKGFI